MRVGSNLLAAFTMAGLVAAGPARAETKLVQTSATTTCMMSCNAQYANCQSSCVATGAVPNTPAVSANPNPNQACFSSCTNQQLQCQINCSRTLSN